MAFTLSHLGRGIQGMSWVGGMPSPQGDFLRPTAPTNCFVTNEQNSSERDERARHFNPF